MAELGLEQRGAIGRRPLILFVVGLAALGLAALVFHFWGAQLIGAIDTILIDARRAQLGLPVVIALFCATAYLGAPQTMLIAACVFAFGAENGFWYSWLATIISGALTFATGQFVRRTSSSAVADRFAARFAGLIARNGFLASLLVRFVPGPPFILVNVVLATAGVRFWPYVAGLTLGVLPKTALIAFAGRSLSLALKGELAMAVALGAAIAICFAAIIAARRLTQQGQLRR